MFVKTTAPETRSAMENLERAHGGTYSADRTASEVSDRDSGLWLLASQSRHLGWRRVRAQGLTDSAEWIKPGRFPLGKRVFDVLVSLVLLALLAPVLLLLCAIIVFDSPGPALFLQERVGEGGRIFRLWKFRSMHVATPKFARSPVSGDDPRMTPVGRFIRRLSLDELPQLVNVLRGEMSLVGPRPEMPFLVAEYTPLQRRRLEGRPGITGLWQISEGRLAPIHENLQYDLHYLRHRNVMLDAAILLRTAAVVLSGKETV